MLARAGLTGHTDPSQKYQTFEEFWNLAPPFVGKPVFASFLELLQSPIVQRYNHHAGREKTKSVALFKTHKTGSSTFSSVLNRFSAREDLRVFKLGIGSVIPKQSFWKAFEYDRESIKSKSYDTVFQHVSDHGDDMQLKMSTVFSFYNHIIDKPFVVSILREPISQTLSWLCFYRLPEDIAGVEQMIEKIPSNIQCAEFGIKTRQQLDSFLANELNVFKLMCVSERFDECMVMMRRKLNWDMLDITYLRVNDGDEVR
jgi:hypothetical protein